MIERENDNWRLLDRLREFLTSERLTANMLVAAGTTAQPFSDIRSITLTEDAAAPFLAGARRAAANMQRARDFAPGYRPDDDEVLVIDLASYPELHEWAERLMAIGELQSFDGSREFVSHFRAFATHVAGADMQAVFARRASPAKELARSRWIPLILSGGAFDRVDDRIFLFDEGVDLVLWSDHLFVLSSAALNSLLPTFEVMVTEVRATVVRLAPFVSNDGAFSAAVTGQAQMRSKLMQIASRPYLATLTIDDLKAQISRRGLPIEVVRGADGVERLVFDDAPASRWLILKLLDDDYLDSQMTQARYEVNSKAPS